MSAFEVKPALCLDLDGTIRFNREDPGGFITDARQVAVFEDVEPKLWEYKDRGYLIFGVTNQGGVAHGHKTPADVRLEHGVTVAQFGRQPFDAIRVCYAMAGGSVEPYSHRSFCRKPEIGMLAIFECDLGERGIIVDWDNSLMVGNSKEDQDFARRAKIEFRWARDFFGRDR